MNRLSLLLLLFVTQISYSNSAIQTDWSGGNGVTGPVNEWDNTFHESFFLNSVAEGVLQLGISPNLIEHVPHIETSGALKIVLWGDIDCDEDIDMLEVSADDSLFWHEQPDGAGSWISHFCAVPGEVISASLIDYGDGTPFWAVDYKSGDYAVIGVFSTNGFEYYLGNLGDNQYSTGITTGDVDCNGTCDVVGWKWAYNEVWVWWSCHPDSAELLFSPYTPEVVYLFNAEGDDDLDMAIHKSWYPETALYLHDGDWYYVPLVDFFSGYGFGAGDIDGDGYSEVTSISGGTQQLFSAVNGWAGETLATGIQFCAILDIDGDIDCDVVGFGGNFFRLFYNFDQSGRLYSSFFNTGFSADTLDFADMDQNGVKDLILTRKDTGEVRWFEHRTEHYASGYLDSSILYLGSDDLEWGSLFWDAETPEGTSISFQVRAADDCSDLGVWSDTLSEPCSLQGILEENDSYFQYRVILSTYSSEVTPVLHDVTLTWNPLGIEEQENKIFLLPISPNPASGDVTIRFVLEAYSNVTISVFDVAGRGVESTREENLHEGVHSLTMHSLPSGVYLCRMTSEGNTAARRFVVIE